MLVGATKDRSHGELMGLVNYPAQKSILADFISQPELLPRITDQAESGLLKIYVDEIYKHIKTSHLEVQKKEHKHAGLVNTLSMNGPRALRLLYEVVEEVLKQKAPAPAAAGAAVAIERTIRRDLGLAACHRVPYTIRLIPPEKLQPICLHQLRGQHAGHVVEVRGLVSRVSPPRPLMKLALYRCESCENLSYHAVEGSSFTPLKHCEKEPLCRKKKDTLKLSLEDSRFTSAQAVWIQELPENVPSGKVPHQLKLSVKGTELSDLIRPGQAIRVRGFYVIQSRPTSLGFGPTTSSTMESQPIIEVQEVQPLDSLSVDHNEVRQLAAVVAKQLNCSAQTTHALYKALAQNLAPTIHGHDDVKKALILQLVGGVKLQDKVRGSIHVLLIGDPGIAKSQMLLRICKVASRSKYTCGRGVSGVGLTASVTKDSGTGEFTLQAGATVLADQGICCIDEFDKMNEQDRTAIHEVMEQQTVSISKAGIVATLNARTSILAAANPVGGRYDADKSLMENVGLPAALLSRFDFVFVMMDQCTSQEQDVEMARHLLTVHRQGGDVRPPNDSNFILDAPVIRELICQAQAHKPYLPLKLHEEIAKRYVEARQSRSTESYVTARTLTGLLRLSQALAKLRFADEICLEDVVEAERLLTASKASVAEKRAARRDENYSKELRVAKRWILSLPPNQIFSFDEAADRLMAEKSVGLSDFDLALNELIGDARVEYVGNGQTNFRLLQ